MKDEKKIFLLLAVFFTAAFVFSFFFAKESIGYMIENDPVLFGLGVFCAAAGAFSWVVALKHFEDPNYDVWRVVVLVAFGVACMIFGGYAAQHKLDVQDGIVKEAKK